MNRNGQFAFESLSGVSFWAEQYLISYKDCFKYLKGKLFREKTTIPEFIK